LNKTNLTLVKLFGAGKLIEFFHSKQKLITWKIEGSHSISDWNIIKIVYSLMNKQNCPEKIPIYLAEYSYLLKYIFRLEYRS